MLGGGAGGDVGGMGGLGPGDGFGGGGGCGGLGGTAGGGGEKPSSGAGGHGGGTCGGGANGGGKNGGVSGGGSGGGGLGRGASGGKPGGVDGGGTLGGGADTTTVCVRGTEMALMETPTPALFNAVTKLLEETELTTLADVGPSACKPIRTETMMDVSESEMTATYASAMRRLLAIAVRKAASVESAIAS